MIICISVVIPIACLYFIALLMQIIKQPPLNIIVFILKIFAITTVFSTSTIVTNSFLALFAIPVFHSYYFFEEQLEKSSNSRSKKTLKKLVSELTNPVRFNTALPASQ